MTQDSSVTSSAAETKSWSGWPARARVLLVLGILIGLAVLVRQPGTDISSLIQKVESLGYWGVVVFIFGYAVAVVSFVPGSLLTMAAGTVFGLGQGIMYVFVAATLGSTAAFFVSRSVARAMIEKKLRHNIKFAAIDKAIAAHGLKIVLLLRLSPAFPFTLLNYALGLTKVRFRDYFIASIGMLPGTILYVYYGKLAGDVAMLIGSEAVEKDIGYYIVLGLGLVATIVVTIVVARLARRALNEITGA